MPFHGAVQTTMHEAHMASHAQTNTAHMRTRQACVEAVQVLHWDYTGIVLAPSGFPTDAALMFRFGTVLVLYRRRASTVLVVLQLADCE